MKEPPRVRDAVRVLAIEVAVYAAFVALYLVAVMRTLRPWLVAQADRHHLLYAGLCLVLMLGQGVVLEFVTSWLLRRFARARRQEEE